VRNSRNRSNEPKERLTLTVNEACSWLQINRTGIHRWLRNGLAEGTKEANRRRVYVDSLYVGDGHDLDPDTAMLLTITQAQTKFSLCRKSIYNHLNCGQLPYVRIPSGSIRIVVKAGAEKAAQPDQANVANA
jgi:predicted site-specific integrase-resolvase